MANPNIPPGPGRPKGLPNKSTVAAREAIAMFVDNNADRLQTWLDEIAKDNPEKAFTLFQSVIEYHVPKLQRSTVVGDEDNPIVVKNTLDDSEVLKRYIESQK